MCPMCLCDKARLDEQLRRVNEVTPSNQIISKHKVKIIHAILDFYYETPTNLIWRDVPQIGVIINVGTSILAICIWTNAEPI